MEWWQRVKFIREIRHPKSGVFAREIGITAQRMSDIEAGRHRNPSLKTLRKLANGLGLTISELVGEIPTRANYLDTRAGGGANGVSHSKDHPAPLQGGVSTHDPVVVALYDRFRSDVARVAEHLIEVVAQHAQLAGAPDAAAKHESDKTG